MALYDVVMTAPGLAAPAVALLEQAGCAIHYMPPYPSAEAVAALTGQVQAHAILTRQGPVLAAAMDASPRLRIVARHGVGVDDVDLAAAKARGLLVTRTPGANTRGVAEHTMAMILALAKDLRPLSAAIAEGRWRDGAPAVRDVADLRLGLVGYGPIGQAVARMAEAFGMRVSIYAPSRGGSLAALLAESDVLSLHCPATPETHHLIDAAALAALPRGAVVINTSRGGLIDEAALFAALENGHIAGAGLDVFEGEPPTPDHPLRRHPRVIATPHMAGASAGSLVSMGVMAAECIVAALTGAPVPPDRIVAT